MNETLFPDLLEDLTEEEKAYKLIESRLVECVDKNHAPLELLVGQKLADYFSISYASSVICTFRFGKKVSFLALPSSLYKKQPLPEGFYPASSRMVRKNIQDPADLLNYLTLIIDSLETAIYSQPKEMDICHLYNECSDAKRCVFDREHSLHCGYKKIMKSGRIFYGKNRNV